MQQIALQHTGSHVWANKMTAMERSARGVDHSSGSGFTLASAESPQAKAHITPKTNTHAASLASPAKLSSSDGLSIGDVVDPLISIAGGALMGGPVGALTSAANVVFEAISGDSVVGHVASLFEAAAPAATSTANANRAYLSAGGLAAASQ